MKRFESNEFSIGTMKIVTTNELNIFIHHGKHFDYQLYEFKKLMTYTSAASY